jgi:hypothetical protein
MTAIDLTIWGGAALSVLGLIGLGWCILRVARAKRARLSDEEMRAVLQATLPFNLGALLLSMLGLMLVIVGIFLG